MVAGRHGSHGRSTDCATVAATILAKTAVDGVKLTTNDLSLTTKLVFVSDTDFLRVCRFSEVNATPVVECYHHSSPIENVENSPAERKKDETLAVNSRTL